MNNFYIIFTYLIIAFGLHVKAYSQVDRVMTYNIKYDNPKDSLNKWDNRKLEMVNLIKHYEPDIFGIQEGLLHQLNYLDSTLIDYRRIGVGRDDGKEKGEFSAIYYKRDKLLLLDESTFWLSETSDIVSTGWDASMERICTYGLFKSKISNQNFLVFNTHYDHKGKIAREKSSALIVKKIAKINKNDFPVLLMGDFNSEPDSGAIKTIRKEFKDGAKLSKNGIYGPIGTYTGFQKNTVAEKRIDYIFLNGFKVLKYSHVDDKMKGGNYLSDHLPVLIELK